MFEGSLFPIECLLLLQFRKGYFLLDSLISLQEIPWANEFLKIFRGHAVAECQAFDFGFANDGFGGDLQDALWFLGLVINLGNCLGVGFKLPGF